ncbi:MAG: rod-binding protein [Planctomycetes bacterium]|nr:rod-binding protein [Planctomycetota bacterium]
MDSVDQITTRAIPADRRQGDALLRQMANEVVGAAFFGPLLKTAHNSVLKGKYGHGGRGEEIFQGQLDAELARSIARGVRTNLAETLYRKLTRQV